MNSFEPRGRTEASWASRLNQAGVLFFCCDQLQRDQGRDNNLVFIVTSGLLPLGSLPLTEELKALAVANQFHSGGVPVFPPPSSSLGDGANTDPRSPENMFRKRLVSLRTRNSQPRSAGRQLPPFNR